MAEDISQSGLAEANKNQAEFSGHGKSRGAAGFLDPATQGSEYDHLGQRGDSLSVTPRQGWVWHYYHSRRVG